MFWFKRKREAGDWQPISEANLYDLIIESEGEMTAKERRYWDKIKIVPAKWQENSYGKIGGGFWVVGLIGNEVIWYNDIEDGFNISSYSVYGTIDEYSCNQDELHFTIKRLAYYLENGY